VKISEKKLRQIIKSRITKKSKLLEAKELPSDIDSYKEPKSGYTGKVNVGSANMELVKTAESGKDKIYLFDDSDSNYQYAYVIETDNENTTHVALTRSPETPSISLENPRWVPGGTAEKALMDLFRAWWSGIKKDTDDTDDDTDKEATKKAASDKAIEEKPKALGAKYRSKMDAMYKSLKSWGGHGNISTSTASPYIVRIKVKSTEFDEKTVQVNVRPYYCEERDKCYPVIIGGYVGGKEGAKGGNSIAWWWAHAIAEIGQGGYVDDQEEKECGDLARIAGWLDKQKAPYIASNGKTLWGPWGTRVRESFKEQEGANMGPSETDEDALERMTSYWSTSDLNATVSEKKLGSVLSHSSDREKRYGGTGKTTAQGGSPGRYVIKLT